MSQLLDGALVNKLKNLHQLEGLILQWRTQQREFVEEDAHNYSLANDALLL